ncbi:MAG: DUF3530 family protein [Methylococcales bacterium]
MHRVLLLAVIYCCMANSWATNELREIEYAEAIEHSFSIGKITWLEVKDRKFLALYAETEEEANLGTVILLHPMDGQPNQAKIIRPLRTYLPLYKWATLSLQMPVLGVGANEAEYYALFDDAKDRIQAAIDFLVAAKVKNIVLMGYGLGGTMAVYYLNKSTDEEKVKALVTISLIVPKSKQKNAQIIDFIGNIKQPFLDIFAEFDAPEVRDSARQRRIAEKANSNYRQFEIKGEGHLFQHDEGMVVKRVYSWINRTFK